jgi:hypothetical protein
MDHCRNPTLAEWLIRPGRIYKRKVSQIPLGPRPLRMQIQGRPKPVKPMN